MKDLIQNQIALALIVFLVIVVMTYLYDPANAKGSCHTNHHSRRFVSNRIFDGQKVN